MIKQRVLSLVVATILMIPTVVFCQVDHSARDYVLRVESANPDNPNVAFTGAYAFGDSLKDPELTFVEKQTPYELKFSADTFVGLFQDSSRKNGIQVYLVAMKDGRKLSKVSGRGPLNILHAGNGNLSFGWPLLHEGVRH